MNEGMNILIKQTNKQQQQTKHNTSDRFHL